MTIFVLILILLASLLSTYVGAVLILASFAKGMMSLGSEDRAEGWVGLLLGITGVIGFIYSVIALAVTAVS